MTIKLWRILIKNDLIGGFTSNFSTSKYVHRYCLATRDILYHISNSSELCTTVNYSSAVEELERIIHLNDQFDIKYNS